MIGLLGLLVTLATFYAKDADALSDKSLRFIKTVIYIVSGSTIVLGIIWIAKLIANLIST